MKLLLMVSVLALVACDPVDHCQPNDTRCSGAVVEVCGSDERWAEFMNCDQVAAQSGGRWTCQALEDDAGHTCLPVEGDDGEPEGDL